MKFRPHPIAKLVLALWLVLGVVSAGFLAYLPELHASLHQHADHSHDHDPGHGQDPGDAGHLCLVQFFSHGGVESATVAGNPLPSQPDLIGVELLTRRTVTPKTFFLFPSGRAPPSV